MNKEVYDSLSESLQSSYVRLCMEVDNNITLSSVILSDENKSKIEEFITETQYKMQFISYGLNPVNRIIMYGASGTGKTYLTKALSKHLGYEMLYVNIADALATGNAAKSLSEIFELGNKIGKAIIFLDECDAMCSDRSSSDNEDFSIRIAINSLFQQLDQMNPECVFVSATNLYDSLDAAFVRRFNLKLEFKRPSLDDIDATIKKFLLPKFTLQEDLDKTVKKTLIYHARNYTELSYYEIKDWVERAEKKAIMNSVDYISDSVIYDYFMQAIHLNVCYDKNGAMYLYRQT